MRDFLLLQLKLAKQGLNTIPLEKIKLFIGLHITQEEFDDVVKVGE